MGRDEFLKKLVELCKQANVSLESWEQYGGDEQFCGTVWEFTGNERGSAGLSWNLEINKELKRAIKSA